IEHMIQHQSMLQRISSGAVKKHKTGVDCGPPATLHMSEKLRAQRRGAASKSKEAHDQAEHEKRTQHMIRRINEYPSVRACFCMLLFAHSRFCICIFAASSPVAESARSSGA